MPIMAMAAVVGAGAAVHGGMEARRGRRMAEREAGAQRQYQEQQSAMYSEQQAKLAQKEKRAQQQVNSGIARGNRRRIRGGVFGDTEPTQGITRATLG